MSLAMGIGGALGWRAGQHGGVTDLLWDGVKYFLDPDLMGPLPDVRVPNASVENWQAVLNLVAEKGWKCQYWEGMVLPVPRAEAECPDPPGDRTAVGQAGADGPGKRRGQD